MPDHIGNRDEIIRALNEELVGPSPQGEEIDCSKEIFFKDASESNKPWRQKGSGEEILVRDIPCKRYGVGVLYPMGTEQEYDPQEAGFTNRQALGEVGDGASHLREMPEDPLTDTARKDIEKALKRTGQSISESESDELDLSTANLYRPSSMAVSFLADFPEGARLNIVATGGRYQKKQIPGRERPWWLRSPVRINAEFKAEDIRSLKRGKIKPVSTDNENTEGLDLHIEVFSRPGPSTDNRLLTVCLVNRNKSSESNDEKCMFQCSFKATVLSVNGNPLIHPYPRAGLVQRDEEEQSLELLYRKVETFAVGHGCAASWSISDGDSAKVYWVSAECMPAVETPSITPDIKLEDGTNLEVPMSLLAGLVKGENGFERLADLIERYKVWVEDRRNEIQDFDVKYQGAAQNHIEQCKRCITRMEAGLQYLQDNHVAMKAFQLANRAILLQQIHSRNEPRRITYDKENHRIFFAEVYEEPDPLNPPEGKGMWWPFQIAFILMAIRSAAEGDAEDRHTVELIWFPTGGGKTEAYLGLAAFIMFLRRLKDPGDVGTSALMRYTLRLLTTQQFLRASGLISAMEYIRRQIPEELGSQQFSIGIWLGGTTTPNTREEARRALKELGEGGRFTHNQFVLTRCPWCGAQMDPVKEKGKGHKKTLMVLGYKRQANTVVFKCTDPLCKFWTGLPIYIIDEDIYEIRPSLVIGTVDKFAMLAWKPDARAIFGLDPAGERICSPPGLIIQDELHMISGPLGSIVGLYEGLIEELCTDRRCNSPVVPKIVCSTATIRRYVEQIKALYARTDSALFPPPGLLIDNSFFARYARNTDGTLMPGRTYVGVHAPGLGSLQTAQVRTFTSLIQAPVDLDPDERDPWWTFMIFFNSLRELGTTHSLFQSDIPDYLKVIKYRTGREFSDMRRIYNFMELTSRLANYEIPGSIEALEVSYTSAGAYPVDVCLASSIIEVGIDIDRLSLMAVVGQPKTTSQYIQVTGRVGRKWREKPGLVVTIYSPTKPRDRSHFEKFRSYHDKLYAQVEPTSVTPFSPPAVDRALHAVMVAYVQQFGGGSVVSSPHPCPEEMLNQFRKIIIRRVENVDLAEVDNVNRVFDRRLDQWRRRQCTKWTASWEATDAPLLVQAGSYIIPRWKGLTWRTPTSMRDVDAECEMVITQLYIKEKGGEYA